MSLGDLWPVSWGLWEGAGDVLGTVLGHTRDMVARGTFGWLLGLLEVDAKSLCGSSASLR